MIRTKLGGRSERIYEVMKREVEELERQLEGMRARMRDQLGVIKQAEELLAGDGNPFQEVRKCRKEV